MQVKICGITNSEDACAAVDAGADAIGLIFYQGSKRCITEQRAVEIVAQLPPYTSINALFVNPTEAEVREVLSTVNVSQIQFHGEESSAFCELFGRPYVKSIPVLDTTRMQALVADHTNARAYLFDTHVPGEHGGTGKTFDWTKMPEKNIGHRILAGGLDTENVAKAIRITRPDAVDVSSGVESQPGIKNHETLEKFIAAAKRAGRDLAL
ncbi:MAG: phosphoribosylanthranilate isomerase [Pseudomonadota bacterium]|nr:phosphoribosylanthranilate isomerase [Pseudomonadota bacterium]